MRANPRRWLPTVYRFVLACAFALAFGAGPAFAQADATSANLSGFVRDPAGAVVTGATVTARNPAVGVTRTATTNDEGFYQLVQLTPSPRSPSPSGSAPTSTSRSNSARSPTWSPSPARRPS
jgi:hypothetical protein